MGNRIILVLVMSLGLLLTAVSASAETVDPTAAAPPAPAGAGDGKTSEAEPSDGETMMPAEKQDCFHYRVKVRINPDLHRLQAEVWIHQPPSNRFYLHKGFAIDHLTADGEAVSVHEDSSGNPSLFDMLGTPLVVESEDLRQLYVKYAGEIPETVLECNMITPELVELAFYAAWCPLFDGFKEYTFDLELDVPAGFVTTTNGMLKAQRDEAGRSLSTWASYGPGVDIVLLACPKLHRLEAQLAGTRAEIYFRGLPEELMKSAMDRLLEAKRTISDLYGPPGIDGVLRLVYSPREGQGYLRIPFIVVSEERARRAFAEEYGEADDFSQNCHEVAHFWWWLLAAPFTSEDWINEGLAEFTSFRICREEFGEAYASKCIED